MRKLNQALSAVFILSIAPIVHATDYMSDFHKSEITRLSDSEDGGEDENGGRRGDPSQNRSKRFKSCEGLLGLSWSEIKAGPNYVTNSAVISKFAIKALETLATSGGTDDSGVNQPSPDEKIKETVIKIVDHAFLCQAYFDSTEASNYDKSSRDFEGGGEPVTSSMGAQGLECANQPTDQAKQTCLMQAQGQDPLQCEHKGPETHDFLICKKVLNFMDGFVIGKQVMQVQQQFRAGSKQADLQNELNQKARSEEGVQITDAMGAQVDTLKQNGNLAFESAAFDAARAGTLMTMINSFPTPQKMIEECNGNLGPKYKGLLEGMLESLQNIDAESAHPNVIKAKEMLGTKAISENDFQAQGDDFCVQAISTNQSAGGGQNFLLMNQKVIDTVKGAAMKAGLEALANGAKGALLHDQAGMVEDAIKDIEEFEPPEFPIAEQLPETASECLIDPNAEGCIAPTTPGFEGFRDGGFNANIGGSASLGTGTNEGSLSDSDTSTTGATGRSLLPTDFGVVQADTDQSNAFVDGTARAGTIKAGQAAAGGGGGAGAAGGGGGGFGGGSARKPAGAAKPSGKRDINIKTKGSGLAAVGGRGRIGARKKKSSNPFSKLLGKNKRKGNASLNFRGPAQVGGKKGSLFQMISNRYDRVSQKDRLLKYEVKK